KSSSLQTRAFKQNETEAKGNGRNVAKSISFLTPVPLSNTQSAWLSANPQAKEKNQHLIKPDGTQDRHTLPGFLDI
ncbi:hypothetical protein BaRGS_00010358, partial [Batillaria attramentaria]